ncbi:hypothetical protein A4F89_06740 [Polynucleobacter asymbioticus]|jgi:DNA-binding Xre family transcriptional regulator|uniref:CII family transcriptional regulator n=1 Tax=Polynucleobacter asymbioticus TaxID=576611 RepID=UPI0008FADFE4|nr:CII family transcriptional regulator [Polynucleobacter asymbioticus]APB99046.1 hypothetical protein A4F89_06740 [Polynucleobacter asymbioticus]
MSIPEVSADHSERARKNEQIILCSLSHLKQCEVANRIGVDISTISRMKDGEIQKLSNFLAACDLKVVGINKICVDSDELNMLRQTYARAVQNPHLSALLFGGDE